MLQLGPSFSRTLELAFKAGWNIHELLLAFYIGIFALVSLSLVGRPLLLAKSWQSGSAENKVFAFPARDFIALAGVKRAKRLWGNF